MPRTAFETSEFYDFARIIDPELPQMQEFSNQMGALARRLLGEHYDPSRHNFRFLLADTNEANAFTVPSTDPALIVLTRGLIEQAKTLDEIAGVLAHETGHIMALQMLGSAKKGNSKAEEMGADLWAVRLLVDAGFDPKGLERFLETIPRESDYMTRIKTALQDVHPLSDNRASAMETQRIGLARQGFNVEHPSSPVPSELLGLMGNLPFSYSESSPVSAAALARYQGLSLDATFTQLHSELSRINGLDAPSEYKIDYARRLISEVFDKLPVKETKTRRDLVEGFFDAFSTQRFIATAEAYTGQVSRELYAASLRLLGKRNASTSLEESAERLSNSTKSFEPLGILKRREEALHAFIDATTPEDAERLAAELLKHANVPEHLVWTEGGVRLPELEFPSLETAREQLEESSNLIDTEAEERSPRVSEEESAEAKEMLDKLRKRMKENALDASDKPRMPIDSASFLRALFERPLDDTHAELHSGPPEIPLLRQHTWLKEGDYPDMLEAMRVILGHEYTPSDADRMEHPELYDGIRVALIDRGESIPDNLYFDSFTHENGVVTDIVKPLDPIVLPEALSERKQESARTAKDMIAADTEYSAQRAAFERQLLQDGVHWELLPHRVDEFIRVYSEVLMPPMTLTPFEHPFAGAFMERIHEHAQNGSMSLSQRNDIQDRLQAASDELGARAIGGIDVNHPYIIEEGFLEKGFVENSDPYKSSFWLDARIDPFAPDALDALDRLGISQDVIEASDRHKGRIELALTVEKFRELATLPPSLDHLADLLRIKDQLSLTVSAPEFYDRFEQLEKEADSIIKRTIKDAVNHDVMKLASLYKTLPLLNYPEVEHDLIQGMLQKLRSLSAEELPAALDHLLALDASHAHMPSSLLTGTALSAGKRVHFDPPLPAQNKEFADIVVKCITEGMGKDDGSEAYRIRALATLQHYTDMIPGNTLRNRIIAKAADAFEAQQPLANDLRDIHFRQTAVDASEKDHTSRAVEAAFEKAKSDPRIRAATFEFLTKPLSASSVDAIYNTAIEVSLTTSEIRIKTALQHAHAQLWDLPMPARTALLSTMIFPPQETVASREHAAQHMLERLLGGDSSRPLHAGDFVTAEDMQKQFETRKAEVLKLQENPDREAQQKFKVKSRDLRRDMREFAEYQARPVRAPVDTPEYHIVNSYLTAAGEKDPAERRLVISALMSAEHTKQPGEVRKPGETLNIVLSEMGPAGEGLKQAIHSHLDTPADIREALKYSKYNASESLRWDVVNQVHETGLLDAAHPDPIVHIGPVLGAGKFGVTVENQTQSGAVHADTLLRPRALNQASREFQLMARGAEIHIANNPQMAPVVEMIGEAERAAHIETNMQLAAKQYEIAKQTYDGIQTRITDAEGVTHTFTHRVADLTEHGENFKRVTIAPGHDFEHLKDRSPSYQRAVGYSVIAAQLSLRLAGMPVDRDRHGGNIKADGDVITHFDQGRTDLTPPSREHKEAVGRILANTLLDTTASMNSGTNDPAKSDSFAAHLNRHIDAAATTSEMKLFLSGFRSEILALGDAFQLVANDPARDRILTRIAGQALYSESTDPVIRESFDRTMGIKRALGAKARLLDIPGLKPNNVSVEITGVRTPETLKLPALTPEEARLTHDAGPILPHRLATQRRAIESGAGNGIGVAMGAYGLWSKFNDKDGTFHEDMNSGDAVRQTAAVVGVAMDVADIGLSSFSAGVDAKTFKQVKAQATSVPATTTSAQVAAPSTTTASTAPSAATQAAPTAPAASPNAPAQSASSSTPAAKPSAPAAPAVGSPQVPAAVQAPATPVTAQAGAGASGVSTAAQAEKATAEAVAKAAEQAAKTEKLLKVGKAAGKVAVPLAVGIGVADATAGAKAGDRERVAGAVGSTGGGIIGGMLAGAAAAGAVGAIAGSAVPGIGTIAVGVVAGIGGGIAGAIAGEEAAKHWGSNLMGKLIGSDDQFLEAMKQLDAATQKQFAGKDGKLTLDDMHAILKGGKMDSVAHVDTNKDGKLTGSELKAALEKARATFIDNQLTEQISALEAKGWGKNLGNKDGKLTLDELKASLKEKGIDLAALDKDKSGAISGKEITDALAAKTPTPIALPAIVAQSSNPQARR